MSESSVAVKGIKAFLSEGKSSVQSILDNVYLVRNISGEKISVSGGSRRQRKSPKEGLA